MTPRRRLLLSLACTGLAAWQAAAAQAVRTPPAVRPAAAALERPTGRVVLTITGRIQHTNAGETAQFDMAMLARLPQHTITTRSPWYTSSHRFTGPLLRDVLRAVGARGSSVRALAMNDYQADIPLTDAQRYNVVLTRLIDNKPLPVREKGPLFIVYPYDSDETLRDERYYSRSAWQLLMLDVR